MKTIENTVTSTSINSIHSMAFAAEQSFTPSNVEGFGIMHCQSGIKIKPDAFAMLALRRAIEDSLDPVRAHEQLEPVELPPATGNAGNFTRACWLGRSMLAGGKDIGITDLNKADAIVAKLPVFMERLAVNHFGSLLVAEPDIYNESAASHYDMIRRIVSSLDDKPVFAVSDLGVKMLHSRQQLPVAL